MEIKFGSLTAIQETQPIFFEALQKASEEMGNQELKLFGEGDWTNAQTPLDRLTLKNNVAFEVYDSFLLVVKDRLDDLEAEVGESLSYTSEKIISNVRDRINHLTRRK